MDKERGKKFPFRGERELDPRLRFRRRRKVQPADRQGRFLKADERTIELQCSGKRRRKNDRAKDMSQF